MPDTDAGTAAWLMSDADLQRAIDADPADRWKMRHELIHAALSAGHNAQNHLLDLQLGVEQVGNAAATGAFHTDGRRSESRAEGIYG